MSCAEQRQKRWREAPHGGSAFPALGNSALTSFTIHSLSFLFILRLYFSSYQNDIAGDSYSWIFLSLFSPILLSRTYTYSLFSLYLFFSFSSFSTLSRSLLFLRRLKATDQRRNVYGRYELLKSNRYTTHTSGTFSDGARVASNSVTPRRVAPRREFSRSLPFGMDEARRVTAASSHEIQSRIFAPDRKIFEGRRKRSKSLSRNLLPRR